MVLGIGTMIADMMVKGFQAPVFGSPKDYDLEYEDVEIPTKDGIKIRGWLVHGGDNEKSKKVIIHSHFGVQSSRSGYTPEGKGMTAPFPEKIEFLKGCPHYIKRGYSVLMYDMRNHGNSDPGTCTSVSWGPLEAADAVAAVDYCSKKFDQIGLLGVCMGGAAMTYAYGLEGDDGLAKRNDKIKAMVFVQPLTYSYMIKNMGFPSFLESMSTPVIKKRIGFSLHDKTFYDDAPKINVPCLVVQNNNDPFHKKEEVQDFVDKLRVVEKDTLWLDLDKNRFSGYKWLSNNPEPICEWFDKFMK